MLTPKTFKRKQIKKKRHFPGRNVTVTKTFFRKKPLLLGDNNFSKIWGKGLSLASLRQRWGRLDVALYTADRRAWFFTKQPSALSVGEATGCLAPLLGSVLLRQLWQKLDIFTSEEAAAAVPSSQA
jgi:hypothetical protein